jgi:hypothetical protein
VAVIRDNTADTTSIAQQQSVAAIALPFQGCGHVELNTLVKGRRHIRHDIFR